jgi:Methylase involved in ubiquinone/menaquinone biosynthesis
VSSSDADAYDRFMGRYSRPLAVPFADFAGLPLDGRVLDVGCGPGALTAELARRARPGRVTAVDPSEEFVAALRGRHPGVQVIRAPAEDLPFEGGCFDATLAQLVVNVMDDPVAGLREMARVTRDGGVVAACVWDFTDGGPIGPFWDAAQRSILRSRPGLSAPAAGPATWPTSFARWNRRHRRQRRRGGRRARHVRGLVGAVHARRRPVGCARRRPRARSAHGIARALQGEAAGATVRRLGEGLGGARRA